MDEFGKATAIHWQKMSEESSTLALEAKSNWARETHGNMAKFRSECARWWMGIDDDKDQFYA